MALKAFISSLIKNVPRNNIPKDVDLILDGGAFNGVYMLGGLFYIKELEQREKINIKRISGCSIGAVLGLLFMLNKMDISIDISTYAFKCLRKHQHLKQLIETIKNKFNEIVQQHLKPKEEQVEVQLDEFEADIYTLFSLIQLFKYKAHEQGLELKTETTVTKEELADLTTMIEKGEDVTKALKDINAKMTIVK